MSGSALLLFGDTLDGTPIFTVIYANLLISNASNSKYAICENGIAQYGRFYLWKDISGIILNSGNSLELRVKEINTPVTIYFDLRQRSEISAFLKDRLNENLFIDKEA